MKLHSVSLDFDARLHPHRQCPVCSRNELEQVTFDGTILFVCRTCGRRWKESFAWLRDTDGNDRAPAFRTPSELS